MITINQYIKLLEDFFSKHKQINTVLSGNEFNFNAESDVVYPVANIEYVTQNIQGEDITHQFEITIADLFDPNVKGIENQIFSDTNLIATDCIDWFANQYDEDYRINENNVSIQKFSNGNVDRVAGCVFIASFTQFREANSCNIPMDGNIDTGSFEPTFTSQFD